MITHNTIGFFDLWSVIKLRSLKTYCVPDLEVRATDTDAKEPKDLPTAAFPPPAFIPLQLLFSLIPSHPWYSQRTVPLPQESRHLMYIAHCCPLEPSTCRAARHACSETLLTGTHSTTPATGPAWQPTQGVAKASSLPGLVA